MDVVGIDNVCMDFIIQIEKIPATNSYERLINYSWQGGGKVPTALVALGRLGIETGLIGLAGKDPFGEFCIEDLKRHMVDTSRMIREDTNTTLSICLAERKTKGRSFIFQTGNYRELTVDDLDKDYIAAAKYLHLSYMSPASIEAAKMARANGVKVVIDADGYNKRIVDNIGLIDIFIGSEFFYDGMFEDKNYEENCKKLRGKGPEIVVFTLGDKGCVGMDDEGYFEMPTFNDVEVMDTTGAGDVFHGAFIYSLIRGWSAKDTARFSNAVSSIKCTRLGGRAAIPDLPTVERFLKDGYIDYKSIDERVKFYEKAIFNSNFHFSDDK